MGKTSPTGVTKHKENGKRLRYFLEDAETGKVKIYPNDKEAFIFTNADKDYLNGRTRKRPLDLDLHIAVYILECEGIPTEILDGVKQWVRDNPVAGSRLPTLVT